MYLDGHVGFDVDTVIGVKPEDDVARVDGAPVSSRKRTEMRS